MAGLAQGFVTRFGPRPVMVVGLLAALGTMLGYTRLPVHGHYWPDLVPFYVLFAVGIAWTFVPVTIAGFIGVPPRQAGLASGLINTSQQIGGAVGVALASTIFVSQAKKGDFTAKAFTSGYHWAFAALAVFAGIGALLAIVLFRGADVPAEGTELEGAIAAG